MSIIGSWDTRMKTPIGSVQALFTFSEVNGILQGVAASNSESTALREVVATPQGEDTVVTWSQSVTKPMRLHLDFEVTVHEDTLTGFSKAGKLPRSRVTGTRSAAGLRK